MTINKLTKKINKSKKIKKKKKPLAQTHLSWHAKFVTWSSY
jgi:hypothetical protein